MLQTYAQIILPLALGQEYTYLIPEEWIPKVELGKRVEVQFGAKRIYAGIVTDVLRLEAPNYKVKPITQVLDDKPILGPKQLQLWKWISSYYMCVEGEVMHNALPSGFKLSSETSLLLHPDFNGDFSILNDKEFLVAEALTIQDELTIGNVKDILEVKNVFYTIKSLLDKGVALVKEELVERYRPKTVPYLRLTEKYSISNSENDADNEMRILFEALEKRSPKQLSALLAYLQLKSAFGRDLIRKKELIEKAEVSSAVVKGLITKKVFIEEQKQISRLESVKVEELEEYELSEVQKEALESIRKSFKEKSVVLFHGVTSSGKTQVYMELIKEALEKDQQVLFLLPEITLTAQMIKRLQKVFGDKVGVYHSRFNEQERIEIWKEVLSGKYKIVIGARSALFLPFINLGLVIVDEEHDSSFKQMDPAPRYQGRDTAIYLASIFGAKTILGTATPSLESYINATVHKKYGYVTLYQRYGGVNMPHIELVNMLEATKKREVQSIFSKRLIDSIRGALQREEQVILFQNRRGYSPYLMCETCSWVPKCFQCDVSLTYHKYSNELKCHYCGYKKKLVSNCESCKGNHLNVKGFGTEKIEDEIQTIFPKSRIARLDLETARSKRNYERIIDQFQNGHLDILVGTQMVTKGLDFEKVTVVGILSADQIIGFPSFRAAERAFQLMVQVSGRAGRRDKQGLVLIQSFNTRYPVLKHILNQNYLGFATAELHERRQYNFPPYVRIIDITLKNRNKEKLNMAAGDLAQFLKKRFPGLIMGPTAPLVSFVRQYHIRKIQVRIPKKGPSLKQSKIWITEGKINLKKHPTYKSTIFQVNVDPD